MRYMTELYKTYENLTPIIGEYQGEKYVPLLPISHTTQMAQIEIVLDIDGNFLRARVLDKAQARALIPCTESSGNRTSGESPHPLFDKLQYIAQDYDTYSPKKSSNFASYVKLIGDWCASSFSNDLLRAVYAYISKGQVIKDLVNHKILILDGDGKIMDKWEDKTKYPPAIFSNKATSPSDSFVRFCVEHPDVAKTSLAENKIMWDSWINYYQTLLSNLNICYITGDQTSVTNLNPAKLRNDGDKAKLVSSNDESGFSYRGRFEGADQINAISYEVSQKAHFALRYLISKQGYKSEDLAIVAWSIQNKDVPKVMQDSVDLGSDNWADDGFDEEVPPPTTATAFAKKLNSLIAGYSEKLGKTDSIAVIALDSATTGRLAVTYFRELTGSDFLARIQFWHTTMAWQHDYRKLNLPEGERWGFYGAPSPKDIAFTAYGANASDKVIKNCIQRLLPCIVDSAQIPYDILQCAVHNAVRRASMDHFEWRKTLTIACSLYKKYYTKEEFDVALDRNRKNRDYLYGRLLAVADMLESWALKENNETRDTNAARMMQRYAEHPYTTWKNLELALSPYKSKLGKKAGKHLKEIDEIMGCFDADEFMNDQKLSGEFLLGYHCQSLAFRTANAEQKNGPVEQKDEEAEHE